MKSREMFDFLSSIIQIRSIFCIFYCESVGLKYSNDSKAFIDYPNDMEHIYEDIDGCNPTYLDCIYQYFHKYLPYHEYSIKAFESLLYFKPPLSRLLINNQYFASYLSLAYK